MIGYIIAGTVVAVLIVARIVYSISEKKKCTGTTEATLIFVDERIDKELTGRKISYYFVPLYEFTVDGTVFHVETNEYSRNKGAFKVDIKYEVKYNPQKPGKCFINGKKGKQVKESQF